MKIAIESNDGVTIKSPFLPTKGYVIYDINDSDIIGSEYRASDLKTRKVVNKNDLDSIKAYSLLNDCSAIISRGMDRSNVDNLKREGKDVFITFKTSTRDAARLYMREMLISNSVTH